jgi:hypothetical protein
MRTFPAPNTSTSLQTTLAADAHLAEGQFLLEEQTLNIAKSLIYRARNRRPTISKTEGQNLKPKIDYNNSNNSILTAQQPKADDNIIRNKTSKKIMIIVQLIYLRAELNSQWLVTESARVQSTAI